MFEICCLNPCHVQEPWARHNGSLGSLSTLFTVAKRIFLICTLDPVSPLCETRRLTESLRWTIKTFIKGLKKSEVLGMVEPGF